MEKKNFRHEFKYICTEAQLACLQSRLAGVMKYDTHADEQGRYRIRSIYFDDYDDIMKTRTVRTRERNTESVFTITVLRESHWKIRKRSVG